MNEDQHRVVWLTPTDIGHICIDVQLVPWPNVSPPSPSSEIVSLSSWPFPHRLDEIALT